MVVLWIDSYPRDLGLILLREKKENNGEMPGLIDLSKKFYLCSLFLSHTHTHTHAHKLAHTLSHTLALAVSLTISSHHTP